MPSHPLFSDLVSRSIQPIVFMVAVYPRIVKVYLQKFTGKYVKLAVFFPGQADFY
jgi:hypothetical protein